ncbi:MAG: UDP-N-acetylglucosamine 2-epimerase (non-hydrolyzing) [Clostridia bacterium]|nr:UDP-N-acetylglucosamine 2-epimerase (non-hydrolyzing) [Clostridia bacterium]
MKLITILGARPQFVKAAVVSNCMLNSSRINEIIVHTGQHYDKSMSDVFFEELGIPVPKYNLGVGSSSHGKQTAKMLEGIEDIILNEKPDAVMVYGDTNSTLAGALAASKLHIPVIHVEAGLRSFNKLMPEEQNRILTDHVSNLLLCPTETAISNLSKEGISRGVYNVGDVMYDSVIKNVSIAEAKISFSECKNNLELYPGIDINNKISLNSLEKGGYFLATIHRAENTDDIEKLNIILDSFESMELPVIFLVHPRTINIIQKRVYAKVYNNIIFAKPAPYFEMLMLMNNSKKILTDSGGVQKEAYFLKVPCVTLRDQTEWVETLNGNWNVLSRIDKDTIVNSTINVQPDEKFLNNKYFGDGYASEKIVKLIESEL